MIRQNNNYQKNNATADLAQEPERIDAATL
jgi:hypothetical protein